MSLRQRILRYAWRFAIMGLANQALQWASAEFLPLFCADGIVQESYLDSNNHSNLVDVFTFRMQRDSDWRWRCDVFTTTTVAGSPLESLESIAFDSTNLFSVVFSSSVIRTTNGKPTAVHQHTYPVRIAYGPFPTDYSSLVGLLWFVFIGPHYANPHTNVMAFPFMLTSNARKDPMAWSCTMRYQFLARVPGRCFKQARFYLDPALLKNSSFDYPELDEPEDADQAEQLRQQLGSYSRLPDSQRKRAEVDVLQTSIAGTAVAPMRFRSVHYPLRPEGVSVLLEGVVTEYYTRQTCRLAAKAQRSNHGAGPPSSL